MQPVALVSIKYQNTSVRDKYQCVFYCTLSTLHNTTQQTDNAPNTDIVTAIPQIELINT
jgi:hypothetical protein